MENNCNKYEAHFIFKSDEDFLNHVANCPDCQVEHEKMQKVSSLISEVRPYFLAEKQRKNKIKQTLKAACFTFALMLFAIGAPVLNYQYDIVNSIVYHNLNAQEMGFPTDEYGLIMVE